MPFSLGVFVSAREADAIISHGLGRFNGAVRARSVVAAIEVMRAEHVLESARISEAGWCHAEADVLSKEARHDVNGKWCNIRIDWPTTLSHAVDVGRVVEEPLLFERDRTEVELTVAVHARSAWPDNVGTPGGIAHVARIERIDRDSSVYDGDEVRVGHGVEHGTRPGTVDTGEYEVVIEG